MKKGLGKGLEALLSTEGYGDSSVTEIKINDIEPNVNQPRKNFDSEKLNQMAESIKEHGIIQPIITRKKGDKYEIIAGERRWRAARLAGLAKVPVVIKEFTDKQVAQAALVENLQREDLNPIEEAAGYDSLMKEYKITQEDVARVIGKSRSAVANTLRLLTLDERVKGMIASGKLSAGHARALVVITEKELQVDIAKKIIANNLSVRETEQLLNAVEKKKLVKKKEKNPIFMEIEDQLKSILGTRVKILNNKNKGKIEIEYYSNDDLDRIISILKSV